MARKRKVRTINSTIPLLDIYLSVYLDMNGLDQELIKEGSRVLCVVPNREATFRLLAQYNNKGVG